MVSVIVPVYNGEKYIRECLRSITGQTHRDLEIIVIDDGSADNTFAICRAFAAADSRIRLFHQGNAGVSAARNRGLQEAAGEYLTFVDADDALPPNAVELLLKTAEAGADFVIGSHEEFRGRTVRRKIHRTAEQMDSLVTLMCGKLYRRDLIEENELRFPEGLPYGEDTIFNLHYCACAKKTAVLSNVVYRCRLGGMASSVRYYPDRNEIAIALLEAYCTYFGGKEKVPPQFMQGIVQNEWTDTMQHYLVHCGTGEAHEKTAETLVSFQTFLPEYGFAENAIKDVIRRRRWRILLKKVKIFYYTRIKRQE